MAYMNARVLTLVGIICLIVVLVVAVAIGGIYDLRVSDPGRRIPDQPFYRGGLGLFWK